MNPLLLAQIQPASHTDTGIWIAILLAIIGGAVGIKKLLHRDPPLYREYASKKEHDELAKRQARHEEETNQRLIAMSNASSAGREKIYAQIREVSTEVGKVKESVARTDESTEHLTTQVTRLDGKIDRILERLPR